MSECASLCVDTKTRLQQRDLMRPEVNAHLPVHKGHVFLPQALFTLPPATAPVISLRMKVSVWTFVCGHVSVSASLSSDTLDYISLLENQDKSICSWFYFASLCGLFRLFRNKSLVLMVNKLDY